MAKQKGSVCFGRETTLPYWRRSRWTSYSNSTSPTTPLIREKVSMEEVGKFSNSAGMEEILQYFLVWLVKSAIDSFKPMKTAGPDIL